MRLNELKTISFFAVVSAIAALGLLSLSIKYNQSSPASIIQACQQAVNTVTHHIHINLQTLPQKTIQALAVIGALLALSRLIITSYSQTRFKSSDYTPRRVGDFLPQLKDNAISNTEIKHTPDSQLYAYTQGLIRSNIVISAGLVTSLSPKQLQAVILHEIYHANSHHPLLLTLFQIIKSFFFFIPLMDTLYHRLKLDFEIAADAYAVHQQKTNRHLRVALAHNLSVDRSSQVGVGTHPIDQRINALLHTKVKYEQSSSRGKIVSLLVIGAAIGLFMYKPPAILADSASRAAACTQTECLGDGCQDSGDPGVGHTLLYTPNISASYSFSFTY